MYIFKLLQKLQLSYKTKSILSNLHSTTTNPKYLQAITEANHIVLINLRYKRKICCSNIVYRRRVEP